MAVEAARRLRDEGGDRPVFVVPIVWKYRYASDVSAKIHGEMETIERGLSLSAGPRSSVAERFCLLQENILARQMATFGFDRAAVDQDFFSRQRAFQMHLLEDLVSAYTIEPADSIDRTIGRIRKAIARSRERASDDPQRLPRLERDGARLEEASRLGGFSRDVYGTATLSQEQIFESLKRVRACLLTRGIANALHNVLPTPYGPRMAHIRVPEPIAIDSRRVSSDANERIAYVEWLTEVARARMQAALDAINREIAAEVDAFSHPNPFVERGDAQRRGVESSASKPSRMDSGTRNADPCRIPRGVLSESENGSQCSKSRVRTAP
jgi:hypothetical protein